MSLRVAVIGDLMLDEYLYGSVDRISQEAPIPIVHVQKREVRLGGAANVCANLVDLGASVDIIGVVGNDAHGDELIELLKVKGMNTDNIMRMQEGRTTCKTRIVSRKQQMLRIDHEDIKEAPGKFMESMHDFLIDANHDYIILQDYAKGVINQQVIDTMKQSPALRQKTFLDPNPRNRLNLASAIHALKPNFNEALMMTNTPFFELNTHDMASRQCLERLGSKLYEDCGAQFIFLTLGEHGIAAFEGGKLSIWEEAQAKEVFDVSGAGDTVLAALVHAMGNGKSLGETIHFANKAAGIVVSKFGTASVGALDFGC